MAAVAAMPDKGKIAVELVKHAAQNAGEIVVADGVPKLGAYSPVLGHIVAGPTAGLKPERTMAFAFENCRTTRVCDLLFVGIE